MVILAIAVVIAAIVAVLAGFNLGNSCSVNLLFHTFENIPVFITMLVSFLAGIVITIPATFFAARKKREPKEKKQAQAKTLQTGKFFKRQKDKTKGKDAGEAENSANQTPSPAGGAETK